jgi:hypothetical protein
MDTHPDVTLTLSEDARAYETDTDLEGGDVDDRMLLRKLNWHILPPLILLYLFNYLDRT